MTPLPAAAPAEARRRGNATRTLGLGPVRVRLRPRAAVVTCLVALLATAVGLVALTLGELSIPLPDVAAALAGRAHGFQATVVTQWRLPRVVAALVLGAALGVSGAIFQSLTRNPLGSPDVIGFSTGAYTGALVVLLVLGGSWVGAGLGALVGGLATAGAVYLLARRRGSTLRLVLVGLGASAMLSAVNHWLLLRAEVEAAMAAAVFGAGSLNGVRWPAVGLATGAASVLVLLGCALGRVLHTLELGDDTAAAVGVRVEAWRGIAILVGVALVAVATTVAGPVAFVALVAPQVARRLTRVPGADPAGAAAVGALLLVGADVLAQRLFAPTQLPVGIVTGCLGGLYLGWLLLKETRR